MKQGLSRRLAWENVKKNYRFFIPRILTEAGLLACFYIIFTLACDSRLSKVKGGEYLPTFMLMGAVIIGLLSFILILYTNSFLMRQRKREFGLYSVLGMEKKHICCVLFCESFICCIVSVAMGLIGGILFYKLCSLAICKLLKAQIIAGFYFITPKTIFPAGLIFIGIDVFAYIINCISIGRMKPVELLSSKNKGEKEPKVKWVLLILGAVCLGCGYFTSLTTKNPLEAILLFFAAVIMVIVGTYFLFTAGSIFVLKALKKKENYYYQPGNITAVSGLLYRMKQNAVGLASIAILSTGVLVMISCTFCLYSRTENTLNANYPQDYYVPTAFYDADEELVNIPEENVDRIVKTNAEKHGLNITESFSQKFFEVSFSHTPGMLITDMETVSEDIDFSSICNITFITEETYVKLGGKPLGLKENEVAVSNYNIAADFSDESFTLCGREYDVAKKLTFFPINSHLISVNCFGMVVADDEIFNEIFNGQKEAYGPNASELQCRYCISFDDRDKALTEGEGLARDVESSIERYIISEGYSEYRIKESDSFWETRSNLYGMFGTLLFLGILLGAVCLFATVLIIYYKQISEGYEDRSRYQIMRKIGMTDDEVKKTIRSQIMLVFFLPLVTAGIHVLFAFPILTKLMEVLLLDDNWFFAKWCIAVYAVFTLFYTLIYKLTAKTYYKIVN